MGIALLDLELPYSFVALPTALAALAFMFQTRHHNLHTHEEAIKDEINSFIKQDPGSIDEPELELLIEECGMARKRYDNALFAFKALMISVPLSFLALVIASVCLGAAWIALGLSLVAAGIAFWCHIIVDLGKASAHQNSIRNRLDARIDKYQKIRDLLAQLERN